MAVDIGGTFTDVVCEQKRGGSGPAAAAERWTAKVLTTPAAPEEAVLRGMRLALEKAALAPAAVGLLLHGTTLATNAIIERKGAATALVTTEGFRDIVDIGYENRFDQYDLGIAKKEPLTPRALRFTVRQRHSRLGEELAPLDEAGVRALAPALRAAGVESVAIGYLHAYINPAHEQRTREILQQELPDVWFSISSEVCPEIREFERLTTTSANAYVRPLMASYLGRLETGLALEGYRCPTLLMTSGGGLADIATARNFPIRLVESGPAGGAVLASVVAAEAGEQTVLSFDMGGTTAKICLLDEGKPTTARQFEVPDNYLTRTFHCASI